MNIGIFTDTYYPQINGVATSVSLLQKELTALGHKVYIITVSHPDIKTSDPRVFRIPSMPFVFLKSHRVAVVYSLRTIKLIRQLHLDLIHTQTEFSVGMFGKAMSKAFNIPIVHTYHTMYEDYVHYIANGHLVTHKMAQDFSRIFCNAANAVVAPTEKAKHFLLEYKVNKPIHIIPTGIDLNPFDKESFDPQEINGLKDKYGLKPEEPLVLYIGRIAKEKSVDTIVRTMPLLLQKLPQAKLLIVGDGPYRAMLEQLCQQLDIAQHVLFLGEKPWVDIGKYYQLGDVFVSASVTETQGLTFTEAMAAKIPIAAKRDRSIEGLIADRETGCLFETEAELAQVLYQLLTDKEMAATIAQNAYKTIQPLSGGAFGKNMEALYKDVVEVSQYYGKQEYYPIRIGKKVAKTIRLPMNKIPLIPKKK